MEVLEITGKNGATSLQLPSPKTEQGQSVLYNLLILGAKPVDNMQSFDYSTVLLLRSQCQFTLPLK